MDYLNKAREQHAESSLQDALSPMPHSQTLTSTPSFEDPNIDPMLYPSSSHIRRAPSHFGALIKAQFRLTGESEGDLDRYLLVG
jgi:hypothetical protein